MSKNKNGKQIRGAVGKAASFFCMILQKKQKKFYKNTSNDIKRYSLASMA